MYQNIDMVFIDDDERLTQVWEDMGKLYGKRVVTFNEVADFWNVRKFFSIETPIYIDSHLRGNVKGEVLAKTLYEEGYHHLYLATGYDKAQFSGLFWIKSVVGKEFPLF